MRRLYLHQQRHCDVVALLLGYFMPAIERPHSNEDVERLKGLWQGFRPPKRTAVLQGRRIVVRETPAVTLNPAQGKSEGRARPEHVFADGVHYVRGEGHAMGHPDCWLCQSYERG